MMLKFVSVCYVKCADISASQSNVLGPWASWSNPKRVKIKTYIIRTPLAHDTSNFKSGLFAYLTFC